MKTVFVKRLGRHHFAHLRSIAEGLELQASAKRYLGVEHGHEAKTAHGQTVEAIRMLARRRGEEGRVLLRLTVNATGRVEAVSVARSSGYELLDQEAQRTVARWRFQSPPTERMVAQIPITFRLRD